MVQSEQHPTHWSCPKSPAAHFGVQRTFLGQLHLVPVEVGSALALSRLTARGVPSELVGRVLGLGVSRLAQLRLQRFVLRCVLDIGEAECTPVHPVRSIDKVYLMPLNVEYAERQRASRELCFDVH
jgi:hypothetical protein